MTAVPALAELTPWRAGATELRPLETDEPDVARLLDIVADAYPAMRLVPADRPDFAERFRAALREDPRRRVIGAYRDGRLTGGMQLWDFTMRFRDTDVLTGGLGSVAVGFEDKRRGVARDMVRGYLASYRERGAAFGALYPFRPDFYHALGFGYGTKMNRYRLRLDALPDGPRECVAAADAGDAALHACYDRVYARTHGFMRRPPAAFARLAAEAGTRFFAHLDDARTIRGYVALGVKLGARDTYNRNQLDVREFVYETPAAFGGLLAFLRAQQDQFAHAVITTQDPDFHFAPSDPRDGSDNNLAGPAAHRTNAQGVGIMYRVIDPAALGRALEVCEFGALDAVVRFRVTDGVLDGNDGAHAFRFHAGGVSAVPPSRHADADVTLDVAEFSSLMMGCVRLRSLVDYGRADFEGKRGTAALDRALATEPPRCVTKF